MIDIESSWNFNDPAASEVRFREALRAAVPTEQLILRTQLARTWSLRGMFAEANRELDAIEPALNAHGPELRVRYLLERGRTLRSSGEPQKARPLFVQAWDLARESRLDFLAGDAGHMVALVEPEVDGQLEWNGRAMDYVLASDQPKARNWVASLQNNIGWTLHEAGRYDEALARFELALAERQRRAQPEETRFAKWCVARALRSLGRRDEALAIQRALKAEVDALGRVDDDVLAELRELEQ
jgi:tetratricopeptide (TPR) repeat protein